MFFQGVEHIKSINGKRGEFCHKVIVELINGSSYIIGNHSSESGMLDYMEFSLEQLKKGHMLCIKEEDLTDIKSFDIRYIIERIEND